MVLAAAVILGIVLWFVLVAHTMDWVARRRGWRLGRWTQRFTRGKVWKEDTRWGSARYAGGCVACGTSWRYVPPHLIAINSYGDLHGVCPFCELCHREMPNREERYLSWWLDQRDVIAAEGGLPPDVREWEDIQTALRVERAPNRIVVA